MAGLYAYQKSVRESLHRGRNVILQAPTGAGKTRAALMPYFENLDQFAEETYPAQAPLPLTCRYAVPMRVLATQFEREYREYFARLDKRGSRLLDRYSEKLEIKAPAIQTGETPEDPKFESPLTFCTIDQLLSNFIGTPYSLGPGQANLNVGAVAGSYLVLDEFHLYPLGTSGGARLTTLAMLRLLKGVCRFTLMTATFSTHLLNELATLLDADIVRVHDDELDTIMHGRKRTIRRAAVCMSPEAIWSAHKATRERGAGASLVVCNTVGRAQELYVRLCALLKELGLAEKVRIELLHSRFTAEHRRDKSVRLEEWLGKERWSDGRYDGPDTIVIGTQVVEVGLNISAGVLHTEIAPASSIIQRAGRCARFAQQYGEVIVYPLAAEAAATPSYRPYDRATCERTLAALPAETDSPFGFNEEQALIDAVHSEEDATFLAQFYQGETQLKEFIKDTLTCHQAEHASKLIRDVATVSVLVHPAPETAVTMKPFEWETFSLRPMALYGAWDALHQRAHALHLPWVMKQLVSVGDLKQELDNDREQPYAWQVVTSKKEISRALRLALPPALAAYDDELGFRLLLDESDAPETWQSAPMEKQKAKHGYVPREQRSYVEHIAGLARAYDWSVRRELAWVASRLESELKAPLGSLDLAIRLAIACHDIGKLGTEWQRWAHATQEALENTYGGLYAVAPEREFLAKTDGLEPRRWQDEQEIQETLRKQGISRPPHACAGVMAGAQLITKRLLNDAETEHREAISALMRATLSAIARHHAPTATTYDAISWDEAPVRGVLAQALAACRLDVVPDDLDLSAKPSGHISANWLTTPEFSALDKRLETWLAFILVRALRLCDQRAEREL